MTMQVTETHLTPNFTLAELTHSETAARMGLDNQPDPAQLANLTRLADMLEQVRVLLRKPIIVTSALRTLPVNRAIGSKDASQHTKGCAADIKVPGMTPDQVVRAIVASGLSFDQCIREFAKPNGTGWTHLSIPNTIDTAPRRMALIIDEQGTRAFA
jgi:zinc D-Ala-D-Ala carboxypeptidase